MQIELKRIDKEKVLFGEIVLNWTCSNDKINSFNIYRSKNAKIDPATETPYKIIEKAVKNENKKEGKKNFRADHIIIGEEIRQKGGQCIS